MERYHTIGYPIEYHHRSNRHGFKAGALQEGLKMNSFTNLLSAFCWRGGELLLDRRLRLRERLCVPGRDALTSKM